MLLSLFFSVPVVEQEGSTGIPAEGSAGILAVFPKSPHTEPQAATPQAISRRPASTGHVPVDASPLGQLPSPPTRPEVTENIWSYISVVLVEEEVMEEEDYHSV